MTEVAPESSGSGDWKNGLLGCFGNCGLCIKTFFCPCLVVGSTAGAVGKSQCLYTCFTFIPVWNIYKICGLRGLIREKQGIPGGCCGDLIMTLFCGPCSLIQEAREVSEMDGMDMVRQ